jgi:hypothetical protein
MLFRSLPADQVTAWVPEGPDRLVMVRAYGTVDPDVLQPFLDALFPPSDADGGTDVETSSAETGAVDDAGAPCPGRNPHAWAFGDGTFWAPPGECLGTGEERVKSHES